VVGKKERKEKRTKRKRGKKVGGWKIKEEKEKRKIHGDGLRGVEERGKIITLNRHECFQLFITCKRTNNTKQHSLKGQKTQTTPLIRRSYR